MLITSLVRHLHAFARDVRLTEDEWSTTIDYLTRTGQTCSGPRQEFILLSDVLGMSMLTVGMNSIANERVTESTVFWPFFVEAVQRLADPFRSCRSTCFRVMR